MKLRFEAIVEHPLQRENLCQCIEILGGKPEVMDDYVVVEYDGEKQATMISLFEEYSQHSIKTI